MNNENNTSPQDPQEQKEEIIPDLTVLSDEDKQKFVQGFMQIAGEAFLKIFYMLSLKDGLEAGIENQGTDDKFHLSFLKKKDPQEQGGKMLRWVKAIDRWPDYATRVFYRIFYPDGISVWGDGHLRPDSNRYREDRKYLEWLEEYTPPASHPSYVGGDSDIWHPQDYSGKNAPSTPPDKEDKQVPEIPGEIQRWIMYEKKMIPGSGRFNGALEMYHHMQDIYSSSLRSSTKLNHDLAGRLDDLQSALSSLKKELGEARAEADREYNHSCQLAEHWYNYMQALRDIAGGKVLPQLIAQQILERYPQLNTLSKYPTKTDKENEK